MNGDRMLLEKLPFDGEKTNVSKGNATFPTVHRFMTDETFYDQQRIEKEAQKAERLAEAEPVVAGLERRLHQEHLFTRILVETGIREEALRSLLDRVPPPKNKHFASVGMFRSELEWREALHKLLSWLQADSQQRKTTALHAPTPTLKAIYSILAEAMDHALLPVIIGSYGMGKSFAAEVLVQERPRSYSHPGAILVELRKEDNTVAKCIETILRRLRHDTHGDGGYSGLCRTLRRGDLLILDEAQRLTKCGNGAMVEVVRDLWKDTGAGIALIGNPVMKKGGAGIVGNELYGAFLSRAEVHDLTKGNSQADVEAWMLWKGLTGKALADKLISLALKPQRGQFGGLREIDKLFAQVARRHPGEAVTAEMLMAAMKLRGAQS